MRGAGLLDALTPSTFASMHSRLARPPTVLLPRASLVAGGGTGHPAFAAGEPVIIVTMQSPPCIPSAPWGMLLGSSLTAAPSSRPPCLRFSIPTQRILASTRGGMMPGSGLRWAASSRSQRLQLGELKSTGGKAEVPLSDDVVLPASKTNPKYHYLRCLKFRATCSRCCRTGRRRRRTAPLLGQTTGAARPCTASLWWPSSETEPTRCQHYFAALPALFRRCISLWPTPCVPPAAGGPGCV